MLCQILDTSPSVCLPAVAVAGPGPVVFRDDRAGAANWQVHPNVIDPFSLPPNAFGYEGALIVPYF